MQLRPPLRIWILWVASLVGCSGGPATEGNGASSDTGGAASSSSAVEGDGGSSGGGSTGDADDAAPCEVELRDIEFAAEELVVIEGYAADAMEVDITFDGEQLLFNDRFQDGPPNKNMHRASRITDTEFRYEGQVEEVNSDGVDGTPSFDEAGHMYFTSTRAYFSNGFESIYKATPDRDGLYTFEIVENLYRGELGWISLDPDISSNGEFLFYSYAFNSGGPVFDTMDIRGAIPDDSGGFTVLPDSIFAEINTDILEYAPTISSDGLEMYFTRADQNIGQIVGIYRTSRDSVSEPFEPVDTLVPVITGIVEAPSFNADETALYYHRKETELDPAYQVYRVTRALPPECR